MHRLDGADASITYSLAKTIIITQMTVNKFSACSLRVEAQQKREF